MRSLPGRLADAWRQRRWRADLAAMAAFEGLAPITVITGGSEGIGLALAQRFAAAGDDIMLVARGEDRLRQAARAISEQFRVRAVPIALDITAPDAAGRLDGALAAAGAYADVLVNCAGAGVAGTFAKTPLPLLTRLADLNITALTVLTRHFLPGMCVRGRGGILNVASLGAFAPGPYQAAYYASKAYVVSLTEALAAESAGLGVRVSVLCPGPVATAFHRRMEGESGWYLKVLPVATPAAIARAAYRRFRLGQVVIIPGLVAPALMLAMRLMPHRLTLPIIGQLLKPRGEQARHVRDQSRGRDETG